MRESEGLLSALHLPVPALVVGGDVGRSCLISLFVLIESGSKPLS